MHLECPSKDAITVHHATDDVPFLQSFSFEASSDSDFAAIQESFHNLNPTDCKL